MDAVRDRSTRKVPRRQRNRHGVPRNAVHALPRYAALVEPRCPVLCGGSLDALAWYCDTLADRRFGQRQAVAETPRCCLRVRSATEDEEGNPKAPRTGGHRCAPSCHGPGASPLTATQPCLSMFTAAWGIR